ncbi:hypothetical protein AMAG_19534 [Allomyces macrogynus ATCC 38327]|uniref:Uncharacterized protein n=1 Tax=Allomyces macrogynus (strain ATCC 38327) TaxID=578462 RepID=A0A0L0SWG4_ALLM3|nr:hypothetical protein AMAG_19534 [Allomyces macrogynus ATCC 38327]|eukprot:KNE66847.1 hypothetical protein AMAG_19534 [Allomyces macrogynus ATCC 38327]
MDRLMQSASEDNVSDDSQEEFEAVHRGDLRRQSGVGRARGKRRGRRRNEPNAETAVADLIHAANARYVSKDYDPFFLVPSTARTSTVAAAPATVTLPPPPPPLTVLTPPPPAPLLHPNAAANSARALDTLIGAAPATAPVSTASGGGGTNKAAALRRRAKRTRFDDVDDDVEDDETGVRQAEPEKEEDDDGDDDIDLDAQYAVGNVANWIHAHSAAPPVNGAVYQPPPPAPLAVPTAAPQDPDADPESYATDPYQHLRDAMDRLMQSASEDNVSDDSQEEFEAVHRDDLRRQSGVGRARGERRGHYSLVSMCAETAVPDLIHAANARYVSKDYDAARRRVPSQAIQLQPGRDAAYRVLAVSSRKSKRITAAR